MFIANPPFKGEQRIDILSEVERLVRVVVDRIAKIQAMTAFSKSCQSVGQLVGRLARIPAAPGHSKSITVKKFKIDSAPTKDAFCALNDKMLNEEPPDLVLAVDPGPISDDLTRKAYRETD